MPDDPRWLAAKGAYFAVADGMGAVGAEFAGQRTVRSALSAYYHDPSPEPAASLLRAVRTANVDLSRLNRARGASVRLFSTLVAAVVTGDQALVGAVGDSRAYLVRGCFMWRITRDHTLAAEPVAVGGGAAIGGRPDRRSSPLTRALGAADAVQVDLFQVPLQPGDTLLLCSDGLSEALPETRIAETIQAVAPGRAAWELVGRAGRQRWGDNATAIVVRVWPGLVPAEMRAASRAYPRPASSATAPPAVAPAAVATRSTPAAGRSGLPQPDWLPLVEVTGGMAVAAGVVATMLSVTVR
jgi:serine/threonine protein phosphatase PrpC